MCGVAVVSRFFHGFLSGSDFFPKERILVLSQLCPDLDILLESGEADEFGVGTPGVDQGESTFQATLDLNIVEIAVRFFQVVASCMAWQGQFSDHSFHAPLVVD